MSDSDTQQIDDSPLKACTISRDVQNFDLLIEDMEAVMGEAWGDLGFTDSIAFIDQLPSKGLEFVALAIDYEDEENLPLLEQVIAAAKARSIKVILIAEDVTPASLHQLLRGGADEFIPYPLPENELRSAVERLRKPEPTQQDAAPRPALQTGGSGRKGAIIAVHGLAGGTGATTLAVNLAWELATLTKVKAPKVCILDFDLQFGSVSTFLDLQRRDAVFELLTDTENMDSESFDQALLTHGDVLRALTSPADVIPLDMIRPEDIQAILDLAQRHFDYVIVDMPTTLVQWTETVLNASQIYFATLEMDMRSAQNALRMKRALQSENLPFEKLRFVLNRAPKFTDLNGKNRVKRLAESLGITIEVQLPDGGKPVVNGADHGQPLAETAGKNALRKEIQKLASSLHELSQQSDTDE
ncbi:MAG: AAA family ATPase [Planktotalea sp.]|uniref:AAA family ATPase n=1 Tax=Planktotalea sp. TaxID=2029877 RepID=UPI003C722FD8